MGKAFKAFAVSATAALVALITAAGSASAAPASTQAGFAAQARTAGLTSSQVRVLQSEVNAFIAKDGGTQVAANQVDFKGGSVLFVVPGETYARQVAADAAARPLAEGCEYTYFCAYYGTGYTGTIISAYKCGDPVYMPWTITGSWKNDQTPGTRARFYNANGSLHYETPGAWSEGSPYDWAPVYSIVPC